MNDAATLEQDNWLAHTLAHDGRLNLLCFPYAGEAVRFSPAGGWRCQRG